MQQMQNEFFIGLPSWAQQMPQPVAFTFPFYYEPHPLAVIASTMLKKQLQNTNFDVGKMFGVLVVKDTNEHLGFIAAYSGSTFKADIHFPFVPMIYDQKEERGELCNLKSKIDLINEEIQKLESDKLHRKITNKHQSLIEEKEKQIKTFKLEMQNAKKLRHRKRINASEDEKAQLIKESLHYKYQLKKLSEHWDNLIEPIFLEIQKHQEKLIELKKQRHDLSNYLQDQYFKNYQFLNANQVKLDLITLFKNYNKSSPPTGAGDCAAPKLLQFAYQHHLQPLCMAEFWWGPPHKAAIRKHGHFYPACTGKCRPILTHMLTGLAVDENPMLTNLAHDKEMPILYEDDDIIIVNKPSGLLSVPGKNIQDSVQTRLNLMIKEGPKPLVVHRLDQDTSGILIAAKNMHAHKFLQRQFIKRIIKKRYCAILSGNLSIDKGVINLPLRMDLDNHPAQMVCFEFGKMATTEYEVIEKLEGQTKVYFYPLTGRTHQLRLHAAHSEGLNAAIVGDDLYGQKDKRLMLHAEHIEFIHPKTKQLQSVYCESPF